MAAYGIEFNDRVKSFRCLHCGEQSMTVWGWVSKDNAAHAAYFANLMTGHQETSARLTISIGGWGEEDNLAKRKWVFIEARPIAGSYEMMVREPEESLYNGKHILGTSPRHWPQVPLYWLESVRFQRSSSARRGQNSAISLRSNA